MEGDRVKFWVGLAWAIAPSINFANMTPLDSLG
jgi:hypothetical protein